MPEASSKARSTSQEPNPCAGGPEVLQRHSWRIFKTRANMNLRVNARTFEYQNGSRKLRRLSHRRQISSMERLPQVIFPLSFGFGGASKSITAHANTSGIRSIWGGFGPYARLIRFLTQNSEVCHSQKK